MNFPREDMSPEQKIFYALSGDGAQSYAGLFVRTGLGAKEFDQAINSLVLNGNIKQDGEFYSEKSGAAIADIISIESKL